MPKIFSGYLCVLIIFYFLMIVWIRASSHENGFLSYFTEQKIVKWLTFYFWYFFPIIHWATIHAIVLGVWTLCLEFCTNNFKQLSHNRNQISKRRTFKEYQQHMHYIAKYLMATLIIFILSHILEWYYSLNDYFFIRKGFAYFLVLLLSPSIMYKNKANFRDQDLPFVSGITLFFSLNVISDIFYFMFGFSHL